MTCLILGRRDICRRPVKRKLFRGGNVDKARVEVPHSRSHITNRMNSRTGRQPPIPITGGSGSRKRDQPEQHPTQAMS